jgi:nitronate monooxygenase
MFPRTDLPIVLAPMAGVGTPALAAAVSNAGGIGSLGLAYATPERVAMELKAARDLTTGPINANFFLFPPVTEPTPEEISVACAALAPATRPRVTPVMLRAPYFPALDSQLDAAWPYRPELLTFHFGIPAPAVFARAHSLGIAVGISATCAAEAARIAAAGADFIIVQGSQAGGHCGRFTTDRPDDWLPLHALLREVRPLTDLPLIAAGGLMTGADIRAILALGAIAAQLGTAFIPAGESAASTAHRRFMLNEPARGTVLTRAFSGRYARGIRNDFIRATEDAPTLPFPVQNALTTPLRQAAIGRDDGEHQSLWAGTGYARCRPGTARYIMGLLTAELAGT